MPNTTFDRPDLSAFTRLDDLGLEVTGQHIWPDHAVLACRITGEDQWCRRCGCQGISRGTVVRCLAHVPCEWRHTPYGDRYVTVILDVTPVRDRRGPSRLLDMVPGRSKQALGLQNLAGLPPDTWRENQAHRARTSPSARVCHGSPVQGPQDVTHPVMHAHATPATPASRPVRQRLPRRTRSHMERLPEHHRRLPRARHTRG